MEGIDMLLDFIKQQRWYSFRNNENIIFDRDTGLIWTDSRYFPSSKGEQHTVYTVIEAIELVRNINLQNWGGYNSWRIPDHYEFWKMFEDGTFPLRDNNGLKINNGKVGLWWCVHYSGTFSRELVGENTVQLIPINSGDLGFIILCSDALKPANYSPEPRKILEIFIKNGLDPDLEIGDQCEHLGGFSKCVIGFSRYDAASINQSPIKFSKAVASAAAEMLDYLQAYESKAAETISEAAKISLKLNAKYIESPHLSPEENKLLAERQKFLAQRLALGTEDTKAQILSFKAQAEEMAARIDEINHSKNSLFELAEIENSPRPGFEFFIENLAQIVTFATDKINFFTENKNFVTAIVENFEAWQENYKSFKTNLKAQLENLCTQESIDAEIYNAWYDDWQKLRFNIEGRVFPLAKFALKENLGEVAISALEKLAQYKGEVDNFYLNDRKSIYQKFAFQAGGDLQEKFEVESSLYKLTEKFQRALQEIIFTCEKTEPRVFLLRWAELLTNIPIDEITAFVADKKLDAISAEVLNQFAELKRQNFTAYLADSQAYGAALQKREQEFNALVFKIRKGLR